MSRKDPNRPLFRKSAKASKRELTNRSLSASIKQQIILVMELEEVSRTTLAKRMNVTPSVVSILLNHDHGMNLNTVERVLGAMGMKLAYKVVKKR
jgi:ribosome-binding protein aMBF1 (putative translation factor)